MRPVIRDHAILALQFLLFALVISNIGVSFSSLALIPLLLSMLFTRWRLPIVAVANLIFGVFCLHEFQNLRTMFGERDLGPVTWDMRLTYAGLYLGVLFFYYAYAYFTIRMRRTFATGGLVILALGASFLASSKNPGIVQALGSIFITGVWFNCFYISIRNSRAQLNLVDFLVCQCPFFETSYLPIPPLLSEVIRSAPTSLESRIKTQRRGLVLLVVIALAAFIERKMKLFSGWSLIVSSSAFPFLSWQAGMAGHRGFDYTVPEAWGVLLLSYLVILIGYFPTQGVAVAACRMMGLDIMAPIYDVFGARSMFQFFERTNHYYCRLLLDLFVTPIFKSLNWVRSRQVRLITAFFSGIILCGLAYHYLKLFSATYYLKIGYPAGFFVNGIYWAMLAVVTCLSFVYERSQAEQTRWQMRSLVRTFAYFVVGALMVTFVREYETGWVALSDRLNFLAQLVDLK